LIEIMPVNFIELCACVVAQHEVKVLLNHIAL